MASLTPPSVSSKKTSKRVGTHGRQARDSREYRLCLTATVQEHAHSGEGNSSDPGGQLREQQDLPQIKTAVVINREFLDKLLLFQSKELRVPVQNVNVDLEDIMVLRAMFIVDKLIWGNSSFINADIQIQYKPQDIPAKPHSTSINDQLGQVEYILSDKTSTLTQHDVTFTGSNSLNNQLSQVKYIVLDKTGTFTQHIMTFKYCINAIVYGPDEEGPTIFNWDMQMDWELQDMLAKPCSTSLSDQLGQVECIFVDKTGTLTSKHFKKCCINGIFYSPD
uniref:Uncharacterized protein n=1 Tax=Molossus molossus TaxID=27622 RepID=A0A7J8I8I0_MOLMO|nr:hypothetical protein HJG59_010687 [Molossus molossus]